MRFPWLAHPHSVGRFLASWNPCARASLVECGHASHTLERRSGCALNLRAEPNPWWCAVILLPMAAHPTHLPALTGGLHTSRQQHGLPPFPMLVQTRWEAPLNPRGFL